MSFLVTISGGKQSLWSKCDGFHGLQRLREAKCSRSRSKLSNISICNAHVPYKSVFWGLLHDYQFSVLYYVLQFC